MSFRKAVNEKCKDCIYDPLDSGSGTWRQQVENCKCVDCPLWELRPKSSSKINSSMLDDAKNTQFSE